MSVASGDAARSAAAGRAGVARRAVAAVAARRAVLVEAVVVLGGFSLLSLLATWPLALHLGDGLPGPFPNDGSGGVAWLWQLHHEEGYQLVGGTHHTLTGAPFGWDQGSALNFQWLLPYYPAYLLSLAVGEVAAFNVAGLAGLALSGAAMYLLARYVGCGRLASSFAGLVYLLFPWHLERLMAGHASLVHLWVFPLFVLAAIAWVKRPTDGRALGVAATVVAAWGTSGYYGSMTMVALLAITAAAVILLRDALGTRALIGRLAKLWGMTIVALGTLTVVSLVAGGGGGIALGRDASEIEYYGTHLRDYLPDPATPGLGELASRLGGGSIPYYAGVENLVYPGLVTLLLALVWVVASLRHRVATRVTPTSVTVVLGSLVVVAVLFSLPSPLRIGGVSLQPLPAAVLHEVLPAFRVPSRWIVIGMVGLTALAALGLGYLCGRVRARLGGLAATCLGLAACALAFAELNVLPLDVARPGSAPAAYEAVAKTPPGVLAEYPLTEAGTSASSEYLFWQRVHGRPLLNGASLYTPADEVRAMLVDPRSAGTPPALALLGVTAVVTRPTTLDWDAHGERGDADAYAPGLTLVAGEPEGTRVWRVTAAPAPAVVGYRQTDVSLPTAPGATGAPEYQLRASSVLLDLYARSPSNAVLRLRARSVGRPATVQIVGSQPSRTFTYRLSESRATTLAVPIALMRGHSVLRLDLRAGAPADVLLTAAAVEDAPASGSGRALSPLLVSADPGF